MHRAPNVIILVGVERLRQTLEVAHLLDQLLPVDLTK